jgi:hypothetical protein
MMDAKQMEGSYAWSGGKCRVPMFCMGGPAGYCDEQAYGPQLPEVLLKQVRGFNYHAPYCFGPCCPAHGGPHKDEPILFKDGTDERGLPMWCAVMPDFQNLKESPSGFSIDPVHAIQRMRDAIDRIGAPA